jgi:putative aldouronate transport system permease protein
MASADAFKHIFVWSGVWQSMGWSAIIYIAALSGVDTQLLEAATIDGATRLQKIRHINFPAIKPTIVILLILSLGGLITVGFEKAFLLQNPLNMMSSEVISTYVYKQVFDVTYNVVAGGFAFSYSAAIGLANNVISMVLVLIANWIARTVGETSLF